MSLYRVHSGTENAFQAGEGGILLSMPWDINRQQQLSANPVGTTLAHRCKNGGIWGSWIPIANATPPQEFDLPLASGFTNADVGIKSRYSKDQMGQVFVDLAVSGSINANTITTIATLPEGFRPSYIAHSVAYRYTGQLPSIGLWVSVDGTVSCFSPESIEGLAGQILFIAAS